MKRSKFTEEQIVRILQEAQTGSKTQAQVCKDHAVSVNTFYVWKRKYAGMQTDDVRHLRELERENMQLKTLLNSSLGNRPPVLVCHHQPKRRPPVVMRKRER